MDTRARLDLDLYDQLVGERSGLSNLYQDIAKRVWPDYAVFNRGTGLPEGDRRSFELFDATGAVALDRFGSAFMKMTSPSNRTWHKLAVNDEDLGERPAVKAWLEYANRVLFRRRYAKLANYASQYLENCKAIGAFGPMGTFIEDVPGEGNRYTALHLATTFITEDGYCRVNGMARRLEYTAAQCAHRFGEANLPERMRKALHSNSQGDRLQKWEVIHTVQPETEGRFSHYSRYVSREGTAVLQSGGFATMPLAFARFSTMPGEKYGRSPAMLVLPSLKMLQAMKKTYLGAAQRVADPPLLAFDDGVISVLRTSPGKVSPGTVTQDGKPLVMPLQSGAGLDWATEALDQERKPINDVFLVSLFQILAEEPRAQTATEVVERAAEKATLLSPGIERVQSEYHGVMIDRELAIARASGELPPMPDELLEAQHEIKVEYQGELAQAQKADEVAGILRTAEVAPAFQALDPASVKRVNWSKAYGRLAEGFGMPADFLLSDEDMEAEREAEEALQAGGALTEALPAAAAAAKDFATAQATRAQNAAAVGDPLSNMY